MQILLGLGSIFEKGAIGILLTLDTIIYSLISSAFKIFMALAGAKLLSSDMYYQIANKIYTIIGVIMLFVLSYAILRGIIDPDQSTKGEFGPKMIKNVIVAVVGLALAPAIFNIMYQAQNLFLEHDVLVKIFFRGNLNDTINLNSSTVEIGDQSINIDPNVDINEQIKTIGGAVTATKLWQAFFYPSSDSGKTAAEIIADPIKYFENGLGYAAACAGLLVASGFAGVFIPFLGTLAAGAAVASCGAGVLSAINLGQAAINDDKPISLEGAYSMSAGGEGFFVYTIFIDNYIDDGDISYLFIVSTLTGLFTLYAFASFSIDMGIRAAKLAYYQIIAPIPLIMQVMPKNKDTFSNYVRSVISTFAEVFIRISVVYIVVFIMCHLDTLFSSMSSLWEKQNLNFAETTLAMAFLILGLVAFARKAPEFIAETLKIPKGNLSLGIGKKFAEGGGWAAQSIVAGGAREALQNWNRNRSEGKGRLRSLGSAAAGFGSAATRNAWSQFGPGGKMAMNHQDSKAASERAVNAAYDAGVNRAERASKNVEAQAEVQKAEKELREAYNKYGFDSTEYKNAEKKLREAQTKEFESTAIGTVAVDLTQRARAWSTGTVDMSKEEADIRFGAALDDLKSKTREEAYKKDAISKQFKQQMETLQSTKIGEYREGWDEQSYGEEIRQRINPNLTNLRAAQTARINAQNDLAAARAAGSDAATIAAKELAFHTAENNELAAQTALETARQSAIREVDAIAKRSPEELAEARRALQSQIEAARRTMEAAADSWVAQNVTKNPNLQNTIQNVISQNADYISNNAKRGVTILDENGNQKKISVEELLAPFGSEVVTNAKVDFNTIKSENNFTLTDASGNKHIFKLDASGKNYVDETSGISYAIAEFFDHVYDVMSKDNNNKIDASTAVGKVGDNGKSVKSTTPLTEEYIEKATRKRQAEEKKGGKK